PQPPLTLVQLTRQRTELHTDPYLVNHTPKFAAATTKPADLFMNEPLGPGAATALPARRRRRNDAIRSNIR
ncbi:MAG TPA: hypothetical protein VIK04_12710, partial [Solirubrobacteraceae bacterium]